MSDFRDVHWIDPSRWVWWNTDVLVPDIVKQFYEAFC